MSSHSPGDKHPDAGERPALQSAEGGGQVAQGGDQQVEETAPMEGVDQVPEGGGNAPAGGATGGDQPPVIEGHSSEGPSTGGAATAELERQVQFLQAELGVFPQSTFVNLKS